jgi:hypothetical protein
VFASLRLGLRGAALPRAFPGIRQAVKERHPARRGGGPLARGRDADARTP